MTKTLLDTGPLVAYLSVGDQHHGWAIEQFSNLPPPFITTESVLTEACFLVARNGGNPRDVLKLVERGLLKNGLDLALEVSAIDALMGRYSRTPMSLADACLVRISELHAACRLLTTDSDFFHYRRHGRQMIPLLTPF